MGSHRLKQQTEVKASSFPANSLPSSNPSALASYRTSPAPPTADPSDIVPSKGYDLSQLPPDLSAPAPADMVPCSLCGRRFTSDRVQRHEAVCAKSQVKVAPNRPQTSHPSSAASTATAPAGQWRSGHEEFQKALQYAKKLTAMQKAGVNIASLPPPPPAANPDYVECPHCQRRFNKTAGERHIPACANTINKPKPPPQRRPTTAAPPTSSALPNVGAANGSPKKAAPQAVPAKVAGQPARQLTGSARGKAAGVGSRGSVVSVGANGGGVDLHNQVQQLTATVALLAQQMSAASTSAAATSLPAVAGAINSARGGGACKSCQASLPHAARFCAQCGASQL